MTSYSPVYSVKYYRDGVYKLIKFKHGFGVRLPSDGSEDPVSASSEEKFASAISRSRSVVHQLALCNDWQYFFTGTLNPEWHDRSDLFHFRNTFSQYIRDFRKKPGYESLAYLLVPEKHKDGSWHLHGFLSGLPDSALSSFVRGIHPLKLVDKGYFNWGAYAKKFGFCSLAPIRSLDATANYIVKYISKEVSSSVSELGGHTYFSSTGLRRAVDYGSVYGSFLSLDALLTHHWDFCSTGFVRNVSWSFWFDYIDDSDIDFFVLDEPVSEAPDSPFFEQLVFAGFPSAGSSKGRMSDSHSGD